MNWRRAHADKIITDDGRYWINRTPDGFEAWEKGAQDVSFIEANTTRALLELTGGHGSVHCRPGPGFLGTFATAEEARAVCTTP